MRINMYSSWHLMQISDVILYDQCHNRVGEVISAVTFSVVVDTRVSVPFGIWLDFRGSPSGYGPVSDILGVVFGHTKSLEQIR